MRLLSCLLRTLLWQCYVFAGLCFAIINELKLKLPYISCHVLRVEKGSLHKNGTLT